MNWIKSSLAYAVKTIKADKVIMGIPSYGNDWDLTSRKNSKLRQWNDIQALEKKVKAKPVYDKRSGSMTHFLIQINISTAMSFGMKMKKRLQRRAAWPYDIKSPEFPFTQWDMNRPLFGRRCGRE
ncbi:hypothetical protein MOB86_14945 [Bacillus haynesii]|nr:hypothetical protein [Bacillus haynesii]MCY7862538.1 hypothetical protein [Bacillus haynesii]MCY8005491.1 hypothetical protein [Bacillus haynesii]MCY8068164.1 hypothetical protein [Bacillus haynesii]MCY9153419.1 hypothetical protein [Bacillus haynesii]